MFIETLVKLCVCEKGEQEVDWLVDTNAPWLAYDPTTEGKSTV
jgi:hypothetical protein